MIDAVSVDRPGPLDNVTNEQGSVSPASVLWQGDDVRKPHCHAIGHAAVLLADRGVLLAGDMLSDVLIPLLDPRRPIRWAPNVRICRRSARSRDASFRRIGASPFKDIADERASAAEQRRLS